MAFDNFTKSLLISILNESDVFSLSADTGSEEYEPPYVKKRKAKEQERKQNEPQPFHGLSPSSEHGEQIKQLVKYGSDDPETQEIEPQKTTSWQDVNAAAFNEIKKQRMQQQLQQGMMR
jgi:hypothetical protein